jgi:PAS domain S-box-containing protein
VKSQSTTQQLDQFLAATPDAMVILDADGRIVRVNTRAEKLFEYSQEELLGQKPDMLMPRPRTWRKVKQRAGEVRQPKLHPFVNGLETKVRRRDGTEFAAVVNLARFFRSRRRHHDFKRDSGSSARAE